MAVPMEGPQCRLSTHAWMSWGNCTAVSLKFSFSMRTNQPMTSHPYFPSFKVCIAYGQTLDKFTLKAVRRMSQWSIVHQESFIGSDQVPVSINWFLLNCPFYANFSHFHCSILRHKVYVTVCEAIYSNFAVCARNFLSSQSTYVGVFIAMWMKQKLPVKADVGFSFQLCDLQTVNDNSHIADSLTCDWDSCAAVRP